MFGISFEHLLVLGVILLVFGPRRLPELGQSIGRALKNFKDAMGGVEEASFKRHDPNQQNNQNRMQNQPQYQVPVQDHTTPKSDVVIPSSTTTVASGQPGQNDTKPKGET